MVLIDNSAFARLSSPALSADRRREIAHRLETGDFAVSLPFLLEAGYSTRDSAGYASLMQRLRRLEHLPITPAIEEVALLAHEELARSGHQRIPPVDLIVAALAHAHGCGVLHYDHHYETIGALTTLRFHGEWLAPPGSLD